MAYRSEVVKFTILNLWEFTWSDPHERTKSNLSLYFIYVKTMLIIQNFGEENSAGVFRDFNVATPVQKLRTTDHSDWEFSWNVSGYL
jgi:hypothetical protein